jgi:iron complex outermembrane receptor protein
VKGPTSTLYGQNSIGGTMNAISKMPQDVAGGAAALELGSYDHYRGDVDFYGPLSDSVSYRLVGAYQDAGSYVDFARDDRVVLAPSLKFALSDTASLVARVNYQRFDFSPYFGFGAQFLGPSQDDGFAIPDVPRSRSGTAPSNDAGKENLVGQLLLEQRIGEWRLRGSVQYTKTEAANNGLLLFLTDPDGFTDSLAYARDLDSDAYSGELNLFGDVEAFGRSHTLFFGADFAAEDWHLHSRWADYIIGTDSGFSLFAPDYSLLDIPRSRAGYPGLYQEKRRHEMSGLTAQALIRPTDRVTVSLGTRYSHDVQSSRSACCGPGGTLTPDGELEEDAFTHQAGVTFALTPNLACCCRAIPSTRRRARRARSGSRAICPAAVSRIPPRSSRWSAPTSPRAFRERSSSA